MRQAANDNLGLLLRWYGWQAKPRGYTNDAQKKDEQCGWDQSAPESERESGLLHRIDIGARRVVSGR